MQTPWNQDEYARACRFAAKAHATAAKTKWVKGTRDVPYIVHPCLVSMEVMAALHAEPGHDGDLAVVCSLLHDVAEDTPVTLEQIRAEFGERVADGVGALTKNRRLRQSLQMADCLHRIRQQPQEVWMVKLADRIANLQNVPRGWHMDRTSRYRQEAILIHDNLSPASAFLAQRLRVRIERYGGTG